VRIELDENLPHSLVQRLSQMGHDVDTVPDEGLAGKDDGEVWAATQAAGRFLITQGLDFSDERNYTPGAHAGVLLFACRNLFVVNGWTQSESHPLRQTHLQPNGSMHLST
jgi:predicted nuclease of predicted toxin-antitoxin system